MISIRRGVALLLVAAASYFAPMQGSTADEQLNKLLPDNIRQAGQLNVASNTSYPPFAFRNEAGEATGVEPSVVRALAAKLGIKAAFTSLDFATVLPSITAGRFDLGVAGYSNTEERRKVVEFVNYLYAVDGLVVLKGNPDGLSVDDLCGKTVSSSQGAYQTVNLTALSDNCVKSGKPAINMQVFQGTPTQLVALKSRRVQGSNIDFAVGAYMVQKEPNVLEQAPGILKNAAGQKLVMGMIMKKGDVQLAKALHAALNAIIADGSYAKILREWNIPDESKVPEATIN
ncbi:MAG: polar amino acid transport system substrate-binding protein [Variibacter sp.]|nr:polar amino acid transport system substrate-binding protein [Variibacter sp.]